MAEQVIELSIVPTIVGWDMMGVVIGACDFGLVAASENENYLAGSIFI